MDDFKTPTHPSQTRSKAPYKKPELIKFGNIIQHTQTMGGSISDNFNGCHHQGVNDDPFCGPTIDAS